MRYFFFLMMLLRFAHADDYSLDYALSYYYLNQAPQEVPKIIEKLSEIGQLHAGVTFFGEVFAKHPDEAEQWIKEAPLSSEQKKYLIYSLWIAGKTNDAVALAQEDNWTTEEIFGLLSPAKPLLDYAPETPGYLSLLWGAFYASGNTAYVDQVISLLALPDIKEEVEQSLLSHLPRHELVYRVCQEKAILPEAAQQCSSIFPLEDSSLEGFRGVILITDEDSLQQTWMDLFQKREIPTHPSYTATLGKQTIIELGLCNFSLNQELGANLTYDLQLIGPDDELYYAPTDLAAIQGRRATRFFIERAEQNIIINFGESSPPGPYTVLVRATDHLSGQTIELSAEFQLVASNEFQIPEAS